MREGKCNGSSFLPTGTWQAPPGQTTAFHPSQKVYRRDSRDSGQTITLPNKSPSRWMKL